MHQDGTIWVEPMDRWMGMERWEIAVLSIQ